MLNLLISLNNVLVILLLHDVLHLLVLSIRLQLRARILVLLQETRLIVPEASILLPQLVNLSLRSLHKGPHVLLLVTTTATVILYGLK